MGTFDPLYPHSRREKTHIHEWVVIKAFECYNKLLFVQKQQNHVWGKWKELLNKVSHTQENN